LYNYIELKQINKEDKMIKKIIYCRFCDQLTTEEVEVINDKSIDEVYSTKDCKDCKNLK
tara:strand:+ start:357 stop:533 length:177 start_codon:yes stop_codon:yes gene_type:complete